MLAARHQHWIIDENGIVEMSETRGEGAMKNDSKMRKMKLNSDILGMITGGTGEYYDVDRIQDYLNGITGGGNSTVSVIFTTPYAKPSRGRLFYE